MEPEIMKEEELANENNATAYTATDAATEPYIISICFIILCPQQRVRLEFMSDATIGDIEDIAAEKLELPEDRVAELVVSGRTYPRETKFLGGIEVDPINVATFYVITSPAIPDGYAKCINVYVHYDVPLSSSYVSVVDVYITEKELQESGEQDLGLLKQKMCAVCPKFDTAKDFDITHDDDDGTVMTSNDDIVKRGLFRSFTRGETPYRYKIRERSDAAV